MKKIVTKKTVAKKPPVRKAQTGGKAIDKTAVAKRDVGKDIRAEKRAQDINKTVKQMGNKGSIVAYPDPNPTIPGDSLRVHTSLQSTPGGLTPYTRDMFNSPTLKGAAYTSKKSLANAVKAKRARLYTDTTATGAMESDTGRRKNGGKIKKGGMAAYEKSSFDKKADAKGAHGKEGSAKDMKADKTAAKRLGFIKNKKK